jgi:hypothetical protein
MVVTYVGRSFALTHPPTGEIKFYPGQFTSKPFLPKSFRSISYSTVEIFPVEHSPLQWSQDLALDSPLTLISLTCTGLLEDSFSELPRSLAAIVITYVSQNGRGSEALYPPLYARQKKLY